MILTFIEAPERGKTSHAAATVQDADGKATDVTVVGVAGIQNGESVLSLSDGTTRPAEEVTFSDQDTKNLYGMATVYGNAPGANTFLQGYEMVGGDVYAYASAYNRLYEQGLTGAKPEKPRVYAKAAVLPGDVQNMALEAGKKAGRGENTYQNTVGANQAATEEKELAGNGTEGLTLDKMDSESILGMQQEASKEGSLPDSIDGFKVIDGKVGGKIPVDEFKNARKTSIKNPDARSMTCGRYTTGSDSYTVRAGKDSSYFDLEDEWDKIRDKYGLTNRVMFDYFNIPALDDAIAAGKTFRFSHNPIIYPNTFLYLEWDYLKETLHLDDSNLVNIGGYWYVK